MIDFLRVPLNLGPVLAFLAALFFMDSFKLLSFRAVLQALLWGVLVVVAGYFLNGWLINRFDLSENTFYRYVAPLTEEVLKSLFIVFMVSTKRVGFLVDAAILGFAVGAGFALLENVYHLRELEFFQWIVRGFGTAIMHGSTGAILGILSKNLADRHPSASVLVFLPGLAVGIVIHSLHNHFLLHPLIGTGIFLITMPLVLITVFERSERATRTWLGTGFDTDMELLEVVISGGITESRVGQYLQSLHSKFPGKVVGDMLCLLTIHLELSVRAKGILMAREAGLKLEPDEEVKANLKELKFLEDSVGKTGRLALAPFLNMSSRDLWQLYMLGR